jgi:GNAT superfamily N-acetyltransferase
VPPASLTVRGRAAADLPALADILEAQRPHTGYPVRWPLPFPVEDFIARPTELAAWVALVGDVVVGHVALTAVSDGWEADGWCAGTGRTAPELAAVSVLFVDPSATGRGVGSALLTTAVDHARSLHRMPVLDVVSESTRAVALYERHGWQVVGRAAPAWLPEGLEPFVLMALPEPAPSRPVASADQPGPRR